MSKSRFYSYIFIIFLTVVCLSVVWAFWLETPVLGYFIEGYQPEPLAERWEYIATISFFALLALIYPSIMGGKLIAEQHEYFNELKRSSERDHLTGCYNRRKINEELVREISRGNRYGHTFSTILLDVDSFKQTNDEFGHTAGDRLLQEISNLIRDAVRMSDIVGRWGGDEFIVLCPETNKDGAYFLAEKLRNTIDRHKFGIIGHRSVSLGVAEYAAGDDIESFIIKADNALYSAKRGGKNKVVRVA